MAQDRASRNGRKAEPTGVQSIEVGAALLREIAKANGPVKLTELAAAARLSTSRAYKYLASYVRCGLVRQSQPSGRYGIGPLSAELGFAALRNMDIIELAQKTLDDLRDSVEAVTSLTVWSNRGPTVVRRSLHDQTVSLIVQLGAVLNMLTSANGRVFSAFAAKELTFPLIEYELAQQNGPASRMGIRTMADVEAVLEQVRAQGHSSLAGAMMQRGIVSASAPIFDYTGTIAASIAVTGFEGLLDVSADGKPVRLLIKAADDLSRHLGAPRVGEPSAGYRFESASLNVNRTRIAEGPNS